MRARELTAADAARASVAYDEVRADGDAVFWLESRPSEGGRVALMRTLDVEVTPPGADVGSALHGYGGGAYAVDRGRIWYVDAGDGHVRLIRAGREPEVVLERRTDAEQYGDLTAVDGRLWCVRETADGDELLEVGPDRVVARTDGFLGSPRPASDGRLVWLRWAPDQMPWDSSELVVGDVVVAGGPGESVTQPYWAPDGRLWFVSDRTSWWNLYTFDGERVRPVAPMAADVAPPEWEAAYRSYMPLSDGRVVTIVDDRPEQRLVMIDGAVLQTLDTGYTSFKPYLAVSNERLMAIASSPSAAPAVVAVDLESSDRVPASYRPEMLVVRVGGLSITALVYPPAGARAGWCAPVIVRAHPGPTDSIAMRLDWHVQFLTGQGFAVADVDYRGSSGYGRAFRRSLYGRWGDADVEDCAAVAEHLLRRGSARAGQVFITGASAGGYTALQAVSRPTVFAAAVARSAIVDPRRWRERAPRWQRPHAARLIGPAGAVDAAAVTRPVLLIHGADDHVAPIEDVTVLAKRLSAADKPHELLILGAGHVMPAEDETAKALDAEVSFYRKIMAG